MRASEIGGMSQFTRLLKKNAKIQALHMYNACLPDREQAAGGLDDYLASYPGLFPRFGMCIFATIDIDKNFYPESFMTFFISRKKLREKNFFKHSKMMLSFIVVPHRLI